jgi:dihydropteroate synthase
MALHHARTLVEDGADIVDIGAESTRPGARAVSAAEQIERVGQLISLLVAQDIACSIDTTLPEVAEHALKQGACMVNSVDLGPARELAELARSFEAELCLMHSRGSMTQMAGFSSTPRDAYSDVVEDVWREWREACDRAARTGLDPELIYLDPGLGFHKNAAHSLTLCVRLEELVKRGHPLLVGPSRKSFLVAGFRPCEPAERLGATVAACLLLADKGASVLRVHDVAQVAQALAFREAVASV